MMDNPGGKADAMDTGFFDRAKIIRWGDATLGMSS
jgi:hypothetical protein